MRSDRLQSWKGWSFRSTSVHYTCSAATIDPRMGFSLSVLPVALLSAQGHSHRRPTGVLRTPTHNCVKGSTAINTSIVEWHIYIADVS